MGKLVSGAKDYYKIMLGYDEKTQTITSGLSNFFGASASENGPTRAVYSTILGNADLNGLKYRCYNNLIFSNVLYGGGNMQVHNSLIWGNFMRVESSNGILAVHHSKSEIVPFSQALFYAKFEERFFKVNGQFALNKKYLPEVSDKFNEVLVIDDKGNVSAKPLSDLSSTPSDEDLLNFIKNNKETILQVLMSDVNGSAVASVFINGIDGGFYYKLNGGQEVFTEDAEIELTAGDYIELTRTEDGLRYQGSGYEFGGLDL